MSPLCPPGCRNGHLAGESSFSHVLWILPLFTMRKDNHHMGKSFNAWHSPGPAGDDVKDNRIKSNVHLRRYMPWSSYVQAGVESRPRIMSSFLASSSSSSQYVQCARARAKPTRPSAWFAVDYFPRNTALPLMLFVHSFVRPFVRPSVQPARPLS